MASWVFCLWRLLIDMEKYNTKNSPVNKFDYAKLIKDPRWQRKRLEILQRDDFTCRHCGDNETELHVHHKEYCNGMPWDVDNSKMETLCKHCHEFLSDAKRNDWFDDAAFVLKKHHLPGTYIMIYITHDNLWFFEYSEEGFKQKSFLGISSERINEYSSIMRDL